jgi:hypothetical protein
MSYTDISIQLLREVPKAVLFCHCCHDFDECRQQNKIHVVSNEYPAIDWWPEELCKEFHMFLKR